MKRLRRCRASLSAGSFLLLLGACDRPQLLLFVDTDAPLPEQVRDDEALSMDAAVDWLQVRVLGPRNELLDFCEFPVGQVAQWPVSFGAPMPAPGQPLRLWLRLFRRDRAQTAMVAKVRNRCGAPFQGQTASLLEPAGAAIERLALVPATSSLLATATLTLSLGCMGARAHFAGASGGDHSCVAEEERDVPAERGVDLTEGLQVPSGRSTSRVGSSALSRAVPCPAPALPGTVCIPGGFSLQGDASIDLADGGDTDPQSSLPASRAAWVPPFFLDVEEFTVARFQGLLDQGVLLTPPGAGPFCTWGGDPRLPVNCVSKATARAACQGLRPMRGDLPTEAQWEHAARGRGQGRRYPWGQGEAACCTASLEREPGRGGSCDGVGPETVGSHLPTAACAERGDVSRDGALDLGGSMSEYGLDDWVSTGPCCGFHADCGLTRAPCCKAAAPAQGVVRGGAWNTMRSLAAGAWRRRVTIDHASAQVGFRCAYAAQAAGGR